MRTLFKRAALVVAPLICAALLTNPVAAQTEDDAFISVTADVTGFNAIAVTAGDNLAFAGVIAGTPSAAASPGTFTVDGEPGADVTMTFDLPTELVRALGGSIPITFGIDDGSWDNATLTGTFNPNGPAGTSLGALGELTVGILGTVSPPVGTVTGDYDGTITLTVAYVL